MTKQEKNALGKANAILQIVWMSLSSILTVLITYAPNQITLIEVIEYISNVIRAIVTGASLPKIPQIMIEQNITPDLYQNNKIENQEYSQISETIGASIIPPILSDDWPDNAFEQMSELDCPRTI